MLIDGANLPRAILSLSLSLSLLPSLSLSLSLSLFLLTWIRRFINVVVGVLIMNGPLNAIYRA